MNEITVLLGQGVLGVGSVILAEVIRDFYHWAGHYWQPIQRLHNLHHKAYHRDLSKVSLELYRKAQWHNDVPEAMVMTGLTGMVGLGGQSLGLGLGLSLGCLYSLMFLITASARSRGWLLETDFSHKVGPLTTLPSQWFVNRTYHWRHHFDQGSAYYSGFFPLVDKALGTCLSLKNKVVAVTGASGSLGQALIAELSAKGARVVAFTTSSEATFGLGVERVVWQTGSEAAWADRLKTVDILIINHGINVQGDRSPTAIQNSLEVNALSPWRWLELFLTTVQGPTDRATKEVWINTSEAEVGPAVSPLYELSKRLMGDLITLRRLDAPCVIRKLILGPFKSNLNPIGVMSPQFVAWAVLALAQRDFRNIIVTINPYTYLAFPWKEFWVSLYFRLFSKHAN